MRFLGEFIIGLIKFIFTMFFAFCCLALIVISMFINIFLGCFVLFLVVWICLAHEKNKATINLTNAIKDKV